MRKKSNNIQDITNNEARRKIARAFFVTYTTPKKVSDEIYSNQTKSRKKKNAKQFIMPAVQIRFKKWKELKFLDISKPIPIKKKNRWGGYSSDRIYLYLMNLEPIYRFCKERGIEFTDEEKQFIRVNLFF